MSATPSQKFVIHNRAPRVQIEYEVELYDADGAARLPLLVGVLPDPVEQGAPAPSEAAPAFDAVQIDSRMKALKPHLQMALPQLAAGEGSLTLDLCFDLLEGCAPDARERKARAVLSQLAQRTGQLGARDAAAPQA